MFGFNYPPGMPSAGRSHTVTFRCTNEHEWTATMYDELGTSSLADDDDAYCPECSEEGEIISE